MNQLFQQGILALDNKKRGKKMVSKNILAALIIAVIMISFVGTYMILNTMIEEGEQKTGVGTAKVEVIAPSEPPSSSGYISVNVIERSKGG